jgi:hypothetical protein
VTRIQKSEYRRQEKRKKKDKEGKKRTKQGSHTEHAKTTEIIEEKIEKPFNWFD